MPLVKPIETISADVKQLKTDIIEIKKILKTITDYISSQEESRKGWFY